MKHMVVIGAGETGVAELDAIEERDRWDLVVPLFTSWDSRGALFQALARIDGWAVVAPFSWKLADAIDLAPAALVWEYIDDVRRPEEWRSATATKQLQIAVVR